MFEINEIYIRRNKKICVKPECSNNKRYVATIMKNIESFGYTFSENLVEILETNSKEELVIFYIELLKIIKSHIGADVNHSPMYPNFPMQVMEADEAELYVNAIIHYVTQGTLLPYYDKKERPPLKEYTEFIVLDLGSEEELLNLIQSLLNSKIPLSNTDKEDIKTYASFEGVEDLFVKDIPIKEHRALLAEIVLGKGNEEDHKRLYDYFNTTTDVLRLAVALSGGDTSLKEPTRFKNFSRKERRVIMGMMNRCSNSEDVLRYKMQWIRLGEKIHPMSYKNKYEQAKKHFLVARGHIKLNKFIGRFNELIEEGKISEAVDLLSTRPGEFARKLDYLLRISKNPSYVITTFAQIAKYVDTRVILQVLSHFQNRTSSEDLRVFFPKGQVAKIYAKQNNLPSIDERFCKDIESICKINLINAYSDRSYLGRVYIDEKLKQYKVPFSQRSASKALKAVARGSKFDLPGDANILRSFIYWKGEGVDIDSSFVFYDKQWHKVGQVTYYQIKNDYATHSGDIVTAPNGASEFIDININEAKKKDVSYVMMSINAFSEQPFCELEACFAGWMTRKKQDCGEIYEPTTVKNKFDLASNSTISIPVIFDLDHGQVIWTDLALTAAAGANNVFYNQQNMKNIGKAMLGLNKINLYDLFSLHAQGRGYQISNKDEADIIFSEKEGITPFDQEEILSNYI